MLARNPLDRLDILPEVEGATSAAAVSGSDGGTLLASDSTSGSPRIHGKHPRAEDRHGPPPPLDPLALPYLLALPLPPSGGPDAPVFPTSRRSGRRSNSERPSPVRALIVRTSASSPTSATPTRRSRSQSSASIQPPSRTA